MANNTSDDAKLDHIKFYIDEQSDPNRRSKTRLRIVYLDRPLRIELVAIYYDNRKEAERNRKHFRKALNSIRNFDLAATIQEIEEDTHVNFG